MNIMEKIFSNRLHTGSPSLGSMLVRWLARPLSTLGVCFRRVQLLLPRPARGRKWVVTDSAEMLATKVLATKVLVGLRGSGVGLAVLR